MISYFHLLAPEIILTAVACVLMLLGCSNKVSSRKLAPVIALAALLFVFGMMSVRIGTNSGTDPAGTLRLTEFSQFVKLLVAGVGVILLLLAWPTNADATGNSAMNVGQETGEFFGLMLLSLTGIFLVASANDLILLFLGIELASIPTYIMVSISRPVPMAQEAGVKYFFLGAMAAAVMLFGFSYLYGVTGSIKLNVISQALHPAVAGGVASTGMAPWQIIAIVMLIVGFAFKIAAVPMHVYAGDVYQGAATPVTAFLSFVPKTSGMVALIKILFAVGGASWALPPQVVKLLWVLAVLTMTFGNVLALSQYNIKRLLAYSSIAHSGYMLVGLTALAGVFANVTDPQERFRIQTSALQGVLFYLTAYGITNAAAFGVLMMLPSRDAIHGRSGSAETFEDLAGQGRKHPGLAMCMLVCCLSLIGIPLTVGFIGKLLLIKPALAGGFTWLAIFTVINAAISAAYYLRIVGTLFLRDPATLGGIEPQQPPQSFPIGAAISLSVVGTLLLGVVLPVTQIVTNGAETATELQPAKPAARVHTAADVRVR